VVACVGGKRRLNACRFARPITIAAVEDLAFVDDNRLMQSMLADIGHEFVKLSALDQRKDVSERMKFERAHFKSSKLSPSGPSGGLHRGPLVRSSAQQGRWKRPALPSCPQGMTVPSEPPQRWQTGSSGSLADWVGEILSEPSALSDTLISLAFSSDKSSDS